MSWSYAVQDVSDGVPPFPPSPDGLDQLGHLPTVEARIRYWEAVRILATESGMPAVARTAGGLRASYEQARERLRDAQPQQDKKPATPHARRGRLPRGREFGS